MSEQPKLWNIPSLDPVPRVKEAMRQALKNCPFSRDQVVDKTNDLARREGISTNGRAQKVTAEMLDKWVSQSEHIIPWKLLPIFCRVVDDLSPLAALVAPLGAKVIGKDDAMLLKWARAEKETRRLRRVKRQIETEIDL